ncbi:hypothetical protein [Acetobacterium wieringae]|uniref:hypothetical protein n=1 Tax=Acetobacterium wieringae TaxID=52694 RepID=UPI0026ECBFB7|nr:hypothetical protein [Acetobacterium wieringae]
MSFQKQQIQTDIIDNVISIQKATLDNNNFTKILEYLNVFLDIHQSIDSEDRELIKLWNDIVADIIGVIHTGISGFYRLAMISLRSILEMACSSFYYYDHRIEYFMFLEHDSIADKYVTSLVNDYQFFKTNYIQYFADDIGEIEKQKNAVSEKLVLIYKNQCDVVHGRYKKLLNSEALNIEYNEISFKKFEKMFIETMSIIALMYVLRFNVRDNITLLELAEFTKVVKFNGK